MWVEYGGMNHGALKAYGFGLLGIALPAAGGFQSNIRSLYVRRLHSSGAKMSHVIHGQLNFLYLGSSP